MHSQYPIHNKFALVQLMAWCAKGDKPLYESIIMVAYV